MSEVNYYLQVLGLSSPVPKEQLKTIYKKLAFKYHPDRNPNDHHAQSKFQELAEAYAFLSQNNELFQAITSQRQYRKTKEQFNNDFNILDHLFGPSVQVGTTELKQRQLNVILELKEAILGCKKKITVDSKVKCVGCENTLSTSNQNKAKTRICRYCFGLGTVNLKSDQEDFCPQCLGKGVVYLDSCERCMGHSYLLKGQKIKISIPARTSSLDSYSLKELMIDTTSKMKFLYDYKIHFSILPSPTFSIDAKNIFCVVKTSQKKLGKEAKIKICLPSGNVIKHQLDQRRRLVFFGEGLGGDLIVDIVVE